MSETVLAAANVVAGYVPDVPILRGISITLGQGEIVTVLGPNGAGKSTLIKAIAGLVPIRDGDVTLHGRSIRGRPTHALIAERLAYVPQVGNVFVRLSVQENLEIGGFVTRTAETRIEHIYTLFPDLARLRRLAAGKLSGGQRQMLAVGRALMADPTVLMLDEPSAGLSPKLTEMVFAKLVEIRATGISILMVEQNAKAALRISDRGYVLAEGQERFEGAAKDLLDNPEVGALYLGAHTRLAS
ncbi:MAG: ABC transporter ATP-binding protein [Rhodospirillaceae bacterium]|nr:ABC transporter ATP-binding protein [Rhodospirillaceae bacterium]